MDTIHITSSAFQDGAMIPAAYTCDGDNINPALDIEGVPEGAKSLALIMDDPDSPSGTWHHWVVFDMDPATDTIEENSRPEGVHGIGTSGGTDYKGPCPGSGVHRYYFKIYALDIMLSLEEGSTAEEVESAMDGHVIGQGELMGRYGKQ